MREREIAYVELHTMLATVLVASALQWREPNLEDSAEWITLILVVLWMTWLFSAMLAHWGARKTASRVLIVFGSFWAVFVIASIIGEPAETKLVAVLMGFIFVAPFFVLAYTARRWPRPTGTLLLVVSGFFFLLTAPTWLARSLEWASILFTATMLLVPMISCGIALLREGSLEGLGGDESSEIGLAEHPAGGTQ